FSSALPRPALSSSVSLHPPALHSFPTRRSSDLAAPSRKLTAVILAQGEKEAVIRSAERYIKDLANITDIRFVTEKEQVPDDVMRSEEHTSELQSRFDLVCRLLLERKNPTPASSV